MILETNTVIVNNLIGFIYDKLGYKVSDLDEFFSNTGIDGLDAEVFFKEFGVKYKVDMRDFDYSRYFLGENPFSKLFKNVFRYWGKEKDFTFRHLVNVIEQKKWSDPPPASARL